MIKSDRDRLYICRIIEHCIRVEEAITRFGDNFETFANDADYRDVICMNLFQIGELSNQLSDDLKEKYNDLPWHQMYGIRNILAHAYIKVDDSVVWETIKNDVPKLKSELTDMNI